MCLTHSWPQKFSISPFAVEATKSWAARYKIVQECIPRCHKGHCDVSPLLPTYGSSQLQVLIIRWLTEINELNVRDHLKSSTSPKKEIKNPTPLKGKTHRSVWHCFQTPPPLWQYFPCFRDVKLLMWSLREACDPNPRISLQILGFN